MTSPNGKWGATDTSTLGQGSPVDVLDFINQNLKNYSPAGIKWVAPKFYTQCFKVNVATLSWNKYPYLLYYNGNDIPDFSTLEGYSKWNTAQVSGIDNLKAWFNELSSKDLGAAVMATVTYANEIRMDVLSGKVSVNQDDYFWIYYPSA